MTNEKKKQFYDIQQRRCPICDQEIPHGQVVVMHKTTGLVMDRRCWLLVVNMESVSKMQLDRSYELVCNGCIKCVDYTTKKM